MNKPLGLYVHIPFCLRKCAYCDFYSIAGADGSTIEAYIDALCREISSASALAHGRELCSIFFGGGTPSSIPTHEVARVMQAIRGGFALSDSAEITLEANPGTVTRESLSELRALGINRLSLGVQSFDDRELSALGRIHTSDEAERAVLDARAAGFDNLNVDLMYAIPHQSRGSFARTLARAVSLGVSHISAYSLIIEPQTPFGRAGEALEALLPGEDDELGMYFDALSILSDAGFVHYEISNYAHKNRECRHNMLYWSGDEYLGVGAAASSYFGGVRYKNAEDLRGYIGLLSRSACHPVCLCESETVTEDEAEREYIMLSLRTARGIVESDFRRRFGHGFSERYGERVAEIAARSDALIVSDGDATRLTDRGLYLSNGIINSII